ncbi:preprotein translocase subunit SecY [Candidatus Dojkabacteria bacterium]|uniref:Protein translocase subunit SecY n=1 Tax=Candidatus Dojkabacteria bacterium TaxID=2099670 RepID=A0A955RKH6_9BACT|nr:preprotein translocase subunit SecY [Candidatus Dojkabacteria bacterium]
MNIVSKIPFLNSLKELWANPTIRKRVLYTLGAIFLYRFMAAIPPAGIDQEAFIEVFRGNPLTNIFTLATGGSLDTPSIVMIGLGAYINASIIIQLLSTVIPKLEELKDEGQHGRRILNQYTRYLTIPLSILQAIVIYVLLSRSSALVGTDINLDVVTFIASIAAGSLVLMWIGELITENGVGNGTSIIITFSVISSLPRLIRTDVGDVIPVFNSFLDGAISFTQMISSPSVLFFVSMIVGLMLLVVVIVHMNEAVRKIAIQYARRTTGAQNNYLPIRLNQAGVMPIIFASAILTFPSIVSQLLVSVVDQGSRAFEMLTAINESFVGNFNSIGYNIFYFVLIIGFTFFYNFVVQKPSDTSDNLKKSGAFIPGIRPGNATDKYLKGVLLRLTTVGALFLAVIAIIPTIVRATHTSLVANTQLGILSGIGGTSLLIVVSVFLTTYRQIQSMKVTKSYDRYR